MFAGVLLFTYSYNSPIEVVSLLKTCWSNMSFIEYHIFVQLDESDIILFGTSIVMFMLYDTLHPVINWSCSIITFIQILVAQSYDCWGYVSENMLLKTCFQSVELLHTHRFWRSVPPWEQRLNWLVTRHIKIYIHDLISNR